MSLSINLAVFAKNATQINITSVSHRNANFSASLSGQGEVPPVQTIANGTADLVPTNESMNYFVNATNLEGIVAGHIHLAPPGQNGPIAVTLFNITSPQDLFYFDGNFTGESLEGPMQGNPLSELIGAMNNGTSYVNVHTKQNPNGEIRGQIIPSNQ
ncbi:MAG: CHRD domain-containing protein [Candidatus Nitrosocosmicus sp.]